MNVELFINNIRRAARRMPTAYEGDILENDLNRIVDELTQSKARIGLLEGVREDFPEWIRRNCPLCDNGVADVETQEVWGLGKEGEAVLEGIENVAIECQYCGELMEVLKKLEEV